MRLATLCLLCSIAYGEETPCVCQEATNGARPGETVEQRAERLRTALRLTEAEMRVNTLAKRKGRK